MIITQNCHWRESWKNGVGSSERYIGIKNSSEQKYQPLHPAWYASEAFKGLIILLQARQPMITLLYQRMVKLVKDLLSHFIVEDTFYNKSGTMKSFKKLCHLDLKGPGIQKVFENFCLLKCILF